jgi:DNA-binding transcriptional LysR family regulator
MDLRQMSYVVAVVDEGGFTRAADVMHVAQPSLSQAVRSLEAELGVELFHRTSRSVRLTSAGEAFLEPARQALRDAATARAAVAEVVGLHAGRLDLVCLPTLAVQPAAELIGRFRAAHPEISIRLAEPEDAAAVARHIRTGTSEIGFAELPVAGDDLVEHPLAEQEFVALLPTAVAHHLAGTARIQIATLARQPIITTPPGTSTRRQLDESTAAVGLDVNIAVETDHREAIGPLVRAGAGVAVLPADLADEIAGPDVEVRSITPRVVRRIGLIRRPGPLSPAAASFWRLVSGTGAT